MSSLSLGGALSVLSLWVVHSVSSLSLWVVQSVSSLSLGGALSV